MEETRLLAAFAVTEKQEGMRLDHFLKQRIPKMSRASIQEVIRTRVDLDRSAAPKPALRVHLGDVVRVHGANVVEPDFPPELVPRILHIDDDLIAVDKPAGLSVHANRRSVRNQLVCWMRERHGEGTALAHRIDRETSGVVLLTRNSAAARSLGADFANGRVHKEYLAVVLGVPPERFAVDLPIGPDLRSAVHIKQAAGVTGGQPSRTRFVRERVSPDGLFALVRAFPETGRRHQIRVHLAAQGFPVAGDKLYARGERHFLNFTVRGLNPAMLEILGAARQLLHAAVLEVRHPGTGGVLRIEAPPPPDLIERMGSGGELSAAVAGGV